MAAIYQKSVSIFELLGSIEHETPCNREKIYLVVIRRHFTLRQKMIQNTSPTNMSIIISQKNAEGRRPQHFYRYYVILKARKFLEFIYLI